MPRNNLIAFRRGTAAAWTSANPVLAAGEEGFETDTGKIKIGDGVTTWNSLPYYGTGVQDIFIPASAMWPTLTNGCSPLAKTEIATSLINIQTLDFDSAVEEKAQFIFSLPRNWDKGTIKAKLYWTASSGSGDVIFSVSAGAYRNDDPLTGVLGTPQSVTDTLLATNDLHITAETPSITVGGTIAGADLLVIQVIRDADNGSDTLSSSAKLLGIVISITTNSPKAA